MIRACDSRDVVFLGNAVTNVADFSGEKFLDDTGLAWNEAANVHR